MGEGSRDDIRTSHPPPGRARAPRKGESEADWETSRGSRGGPSRRGNRPSRAEGQGTSKAPQQARPQVARSGARHKSDREDYRSLGTAGRTSPAPEPTNHGD